VEPRKSTDAPSQAAHGGIVGSVIAAYALLDGIIIGLPVMFLAAWLRPLVVFVFAAAGLIFTNVACCTWVDDHWDGWVASGKAKKVEKRIEKLRTGRLMRHPVEWIRRGSDVWFALAAALINAITVIAIARVIAGQRLGAHRVLVASVAYSLFFAALFSLLGFALGDAIRAL
jgi:hypothetical protein